MNNLSVSKHSPEQQHSFYRIFSPVPQKPSWWKCKICHSNGKLQSNHSAFHLAFERINLVLSHAFEAKRWNVDCVPWSDMNQTALAWGLRSLKIKLYFCFYFVSVHLVASIAWAVSTKLSTPRKSWGYRSADSAYTMPPPMTSLNNTSRASGPPSKTSSVGILTPV